MTDITLALRVEPDNHGNQIIGEVRRGDKILRSQSIKTDDTIESVTHFKDIVALDIELWAVRNTDYMPTD